MTKINEIIFLKGEIPIRLIQEPYCTRCMNPVPDAEMICESCKENELNFIDNWYFNRVVALSRYKTCDNFLYNNIPINIASRMILTLKKGVEKPKVQTGTPPSLFSPQLLQRYSFAHNNNATNPLNKCSIPRRSEPEPRVLFQHHTLVLLRTAG